jgi:hypothetical protein
MVANQDVPAAGLVKSPTTKKVAVIPVSVRSTAFVSEKLMPFQV